MGLDAIIQGTKEQKLGGNSKVELCPIFYGRAILDPDRYRQEVLVYQEIDAVNNQQPEPNSGTAPDNL